MKRGRKKQRGKKGESNSFRRKRGGEKKELMYISQESKTTMINDDGCKGGSGRRRVVPR